MGHVRILRVPGHQGLTTKGVVRPIFIKTEYLTECSASRVRPYMHQLRIMSLVKCWVCPAPVLATLRSAISARVVKGELLRLLQSGYPDVYLRRVKPKASMLKGIIGRWTRGELPSLQYKRPNYNVYCDFSHHRLWMRKNARWPTERNP